MVSTPMAHPAAGTSDAARERKPGDRLIKVKSSDVQLEATAR